MVIAFEGIDGSGKSTQAQKLAQRLQDLGKIVHLTQEPTQNPLGKMIRSQFAQPDRASQEIIAGLFVADRLDHIFNKDYGMKKQSDEGAIVVTDRYYISSYAYQAVYMPLDWLMMANSYAAQSLPADLHLFIDVEPDIALSRINANRSNVDLYETKEMLLKVRANYLTAFELLKNKEKIIFIDGNQSQDLVGEQVLNQVLQFIKSKNKIQP